MAVYRSWLFTNHCNAIATQTSRRSLRARQNPTDLTRRSSRFLRFQLTRFLSVFVGIGQDTLETNERIAARRSVNARPASSPSFFSFPSSTLEEARKKRMVIADLSRSTGGKLLDLRLVRSRVFLTCFAACNHGARSAANCESTLRTVMCRSA